MARKNLSLQFVLGGAIVLAVAAVVLGIVPWCTSHSSISKAVLNTPGHELQWQAADAVRVKPLAAAAARQGQSAGGQTTEKSGSLYHSLMQTGRRLVRDFLNTRVGVESAAEHLKSATTPADPRCEHCGATGVSSRPLSQSVCCNSDSPSVTQTGATSSAGSEAWSFPTSNLNGETATRMMSSLNSETLVPFEPGTPTPSAAASPMAPETPSESQVKRR